jgi:hypothetical protein
MIHVVGFFLVLNLLLPFGFSKRSDPVKRISHSEELETASLISFDSLPHRPNIEMDHKDFLTN